MESKSIAIFESKIENPLITIAIPTYKRGDFLCEAINSALTQNKIEVAYDVMVVDNNPEREDVTELLMGQFRDNPRVSYFKNEENIGPIGNYNKLYELAKGKYVVMLHDDDILLEHFLFVVYMILKTSTYKFSFIYPYFYYSKNRDVPVLPPVNSIRYYDYRPQDFIVIPNGIPSGLVLERDLFKIIGPFTDEYGVISDIDFNFNAVSQCRGCRLGYPYTILYYMGGQNTSGKSEMVKEFVIMVDRFSRELRKRTRFPWSFYSILTRRDFFNGMMRWWTNFSDEKLIDEYKKMIGWKENRLKDVLSYYIRRVLANYTKVVRRHTIIINNL